MITLAKTLIFAFVAFFSLENLSAREELQVAVPFTDHMVLQRDCKVPVWGFDRPEAQVTVKFAGQTKTTTANKFGDWMVRLDPLAASSTGRTMSISNDRDQSIALTDILVGEVWFSSGQSNMVWTAGKSMCGDLAKELAGAKAEIPIREISINTVSALYPQKKASSDEGWKNP